MPLTELVEPTAFALALVMVVCNIRQVQWGWPLAILSSALYVWVFASAKLYGDATLQILFIALAFWGWWQWRRQALVPIPSSTVGATDALSTSNPPSGRPRKLQGRQGFGLLTMWLATWLVLWLVIDCFLRNFTDSDAPEADAFVTGGSILGTLLLARKFTANWGVWLVVNVVSTALFVSKQLWLSAVLYALFAAMSVYGWQQWRRAATAHSDAK
jgi:nicotinamide mononucleotide transporter